MLSLSDELPLSEGIQDHLIQFTRAIYSDDLSGAAEEYDAIASAYVENNEILSHRATALEHSTFHRCMLTFLDSAGAVLYNDSVSRVTPEHIADDVALFDEWTTNDDPTATLRVESRFAAVRGEVKADVEGSTVSPTPLLDEILSDRLLHHFSQA
jgi:hypothetical protein